MRCISLTCVLFLNLISFSYGLDDLKVTIGLITYIGSYLQTWSSDNIASFKGIRYAVPPVGELRFKDPVPVTHNSSTLYDATKFGNDCPSIYATNPSEDCLFLNIYAKTIHNIQNNKMSLKPVIAFIHPGGFYIGSSSSYGPEYLLTKDIILVTFNYRLGTLGFLNIGSKDIPGNAGLKDQVIALRWVQQNIEQFGGNPKDITLMGYSAGAFSVSLHLVSPMSQGLFQRAIIMSGSIPPQMKIRKNQNNLAIKQAQIMGCNIDSTSVTEEIYQCLNKFSGNQIASTLRSMFDFGKDNPIFLWQPVLEEDFGQERFLTEDPYKLFKSGNFHKVPMLIGFTNNELCNSAADILQNKSLKENFTENFSVIAPICFMYNECCSEAKMNRISMKLRNNYLPSSTISIENFSNLCGLFSDSIIRFGTHRLAELVSHYRVPVYTYRFSYVGRYTNLNFQAEPKGAEHMDDLMYLFPSDMIKFRQVDPEAIVVNNMVDFITFFAKSGIPIQVNEDQKIDFTSNAFMEITDRIEIKQGQNFDKMEIWNEIFPVL